MSVESQPEMMNVREQKLMGTDETGLWKMTIERQPQEQDFREQNIKNTDEIGIVTDIVDKDLEDKIYFNHSRLCCMREEDGHKALTHEETETYLSDGLDDFYRSWVSYLSKCPDTINLFQKSVTRMSTSLALMSLAATGDFLRLFWPFRYEVALRNQNLGLYSLTGTVKNGDTKTAFFQRLYEIQGLHLPVKENEIVFSFDNPDVVDTLNSSQLVTFSQEFTQAGKHLFSPLERKDIASTAWKALDLINETEPELYKSIIQLVSCIGFYKAERKVFLGGTGNSILGLIWFDPSAGTEWGVPFMAEQIVHEFTHTAISMAEFVHGIYKDNSLLPQAKVISAIRQELRNYDKSLHAAYVSSGLVTFHARAGHLKRARNLAKTLAESVRNLDKVNTKTGILDNSGNAILRFLVDFNDLMSIP